MEDIEKSPSEDHVLNMDIAKMRRDVLQDEYSMHLQGVLSDFQYIEEALRFFIGVAYRRIREKCGLELHFKYGDEDIEKDALGKLIEKFERVSDEPELVRQLREVQPKRNRYAHQRFLVDFSPKVPDKKLRPLIAELVGLRETAKALIATLFKLLLKFVDGRTDVQIS
jgi:hypothetical protein